MAARKDVLGDPGVGQGRGLSRADGVQQHHPVAVQALGAGVEEGVVVRPPDMLEHADGNDAVERPVDLSIVLKPKSYPVSETARLGPRLGGLNPVSYTHLRAHETGRNL